MACTSYKRGSPRYKLSITLLCISSASLSLMFSEAHTHFINASISVVSVRELASFPDPTQLSVASSMEKQERVSGIFFSCE